MRTLVNLTACLILAGCAATNLADPQTFRPKGQDRAYTITGRIDSGRFIKPLDETTVTISFDGKPVLKGTARGRGFYGTMRGEYDNRVIEADCSPSVRATSRCIVFVDGERSATLEL